MEYEDRLKQLESEYPKLSSFRLALEMHKLIKEGCPQKLIAEKLCKSGAWVSRITTTYVKASPSLKSAWDKGQIKLSHAMEISQLMEEEQPQAIQNKLEAPRAAIKPVLKQMSHLISVAEKAEDNPYARGLLDAARLAMGQIKVDDFSEEWKKLVK